MSLHCEELGVDDTADGGERSDNIDDRGSCCLNRTLISLQLLLCFA